MRRELRVASKRHRCRFCGRCRDLGSEVSAWTSQCESIDNGTVCACSPAGAPCGCRCVPVSRCNCCSRRDEHRVHHITKSAALVLGTSSAALLRCGPSTCLGRRRVREHTRTPDGRRESAGESPQWWHGPRFNEGIDNEELGAHRDLRGRTVRSRGSCSAVSFIPPLVGVLQSAPNELAQRSHVFSDWGSSVRNNFALYVVRNASRGVRPGDEGTSLLCVP